MDLLNRTKELCKLYNIMPARTKGQNFLIKEEIYEKIIEVAELKSDDVVLEVGPGLGFLTVKLAHRVKKVIAVELDDKLANFLKIAIKAQGLENIEIINKNILELGIMNHELWNKDFKNKIHNSLFIIHDSYKIVANLPYNITSIFLRKFLSSEHKPKLMALMLQKEVAGRITARQGEMSLLSVSVQFYAEPKIIQIVPKENFWPKPEVDSAIIRLKIFTDPPDPRGLQSCRPRGSGLDEKEFFRLVKIGFSARRKMLKNNLAAGYQISQNEAEKWVKKAHFNLKIRAQELSVTDWIRLLEFKEGNVV